MKPDDRENGLPNDIVVAAEELQSVEDTLRQMQQLAEKLEERRKVLHRFVYDKLKEEFANTVPELPHDDLERLIREEGGLPLEAFIHEFRDP